MASSFKRSLLGYDPVSVMNELSSIEQKYAQRYEELRKELEIQSRQKESLLHEIETLKQKLAPKSSMEEDISRRLFNLHLAGTQKVITAILEMELKELELTEMVNQRKQELLRLHNVTGKMSSEFLATAARYGTILSWGKEGDLNAEV